MIGDIIKTHPAVFAVDREYQIMVPVEEKCIMWVEIGGNRYCDSSNGINRSEVEIHRMTVPMDILNEHREYKLCYRKVIERLPYHPTFEETVVAEYRFSPVPDNGDIRIYHISDAHNMVKYPVDACTSFGDIDLLILNGDIPNHCGEIQNLYVVYDIASQITKGVIPVVFSRGNHDMRGLYAEKFAEFTPNHLGNTYYTFRLGSIWGVVLDCGEDKDDSNESYNGTIDCHSFRLKQTEFLKQIIDNCENEYGDKGVKYRLVVSHVPFPLKQRSPFDIEEQIYAEWCGLLNSTVKPDVILAGHLHTAIVYSPEHERNVGGIACPIIVGSKQEHIKQGVRPDFIGCGMVLSGAAAEITFNNAHGDFSEKEAIKFD